MKKIGLVALAFALIACGKDKEKTVDTAAASKANTGFRVTEVKLGKQIGANMRVVKPDSIFSAHDTLFVSVIANGTGDPATISARWKYNKSQTLDSATRTISPTGSEIVNEFHLADPSGWRKGIYSVDIIVNGSIAGSKAFSVK